jgi:hypothetical protein
MSLMKRGEFAEAWRISDEVLRKRSGKSCLHLSPHLRWVWTGRPLQGERVLVRCYHGLGDTIQFIRYMPLLRRIARQVLVSGQKELRSLLRYAKGIDQLFSDTDSIASTEYDVEVEIMELPHVFRSNLKNLPRKVPYLFPPDRPRMFEQNQSIQVGILWEAGDWDSLRSLPLSALAPLTRIPVTLHCLQRGRSLSDWPTEWGPISGSDDILETAGIIQSLDLIITVDTLVAHLAGALGKPTWTLLRFASDWRWMVNTTNSPWYPTMRLYRQERPNDWHSVIEQVSSDLWRIALRERGTLTSNVGRLGNPIS